MRKWNYICYHIPSGKRFAKTTDDELPELVFLRLLSSWNQSSHGIWQYWEGGYGA